MNKGYIIHYDEFFEYYTIYAYNTSALTTHKVITNMSDFMTFIIRIYNMWTIQDIIQFLHKVLIKIHCNIQCNQEGYVTMHYDGRESTGQYTINSIQQIIIPVIQHSIKYKYNIWLDIEYEYLYLI